MHLRRRGGGRGGATQVLSTNDPTSLIRVGMGVVAEAQELTFLAPVDEVGPPASLHLNHSLCREGNRGGRRDTSM